jgi:uncharacterized OB-fold protein
VIDYDDWGEKPVPQIDPDSEAYWEAAADGRLVVQRCGDCGERQFYPRRLCRHCWSRDLAIEELAGTATLHSYTECHVAGQPGYDDETPSLVALVELDLPEPNPSGRPIRLTTHLVGLDDRDPTLDEPVAVTFRQVADDPPVHLPVFEPEG